MQKSLNANPDNATLHFRLAATLMSERNLPGAVPHYLKGLATEPKNQSARLTVARIFLTQGKLNKAIAQMEILRGQGSAEMLVYGSLAKYYNQQGDTFEAERVIVEGLKISPGNPMLMVEYGLLLEKRGKINEALRAYQTALRGDKTNAFLLSKLGTLYLRIDQLKSAEDYLNQALIADPDSARTLAYMVDLRVEQKKWTKALFLLDQMIARQPGNYWPLARKSFIMLQQGKSKKALALIDQAIRLAPQEEPLYEVRAQALEDLGQYQKAEIAYQQALEKSPGQAVLLTKLAYVQLHSDPAKARLSLDQALNSENFDFASLELYYYLRGESYRVWGFKKGSLANQVLDNLVRRDFKTAKKKLARLKKSPHAPYLRFFGKYLEQRGKVAFRIKDLGLKKSPFAWHLFYQGSLALKPAVEGMKEG